MVNPINVFPNGIHFQTYIVETDEEIIGVIKADCYEDFLMVHPRMYKVKKSTVKTFRDEFHRVIKHLKKTLHYDHFYADTKNYRLANFLTYNKIKEIGKGREGVLFEYEIVI